MSVYLTRAIVDYELAAKRGFRDAYRWHQAVWEAFPGRDREARDFLTRLDQKDRAFQLLIVSPHPPCRPGWCPIDAWETREICPGFFDRRRYAFQLRANPTKRIRVDLPDGSRKKNGRRIPLTKREDLIAWLERKGLEGGFSADTKDLRILPARRDHFVKPAAAEDSRATLGTLSAVEFKGVLNVTEPEQFIETFRKGVGSAKAFGFGLLVLAPLSTSTKDCPQT